jgi:LysR family hydrogen peroxide-inducible transcriptional activator
MDLRQLRYFLAIVDAGNFTRAAQRCGVAQPSLSQQIAKLEEELQQPLFDRLPRGAVLTEAGHRLAPHARGLVDAAERAAAVVRQGDEAVAGTLSVGAIPTLAPYLLPTVARRFLKRYPAVSLRLHEEVTDRLVEMLAAGALDLALTSLPVNHPLLHAEPLGEEPLLAVLPAGHALARKRRLVWADLAEEPFLVLHEMHCLSGQTMSFCREAGAEPRIVMRGEQLATILDLVSLGLGVSLAPAMAARADRSSRRVYLPFRGEGPAREVAALWHLHRYRTDAARAFLDLLPRVE